MNELEYFINERLDDIQIPVTVSDVQKVICNKFGVTMEEIKGKSRKRNLVYARHFYCYFLWNKGLSKSKSAIAESINKNHATILYSLNKLDSWIEMYDDIKHIANSIENELTFN